MPEPSPTRRVLITGSQGFIGQACCNALRQAGYDVWGLDCIPTKNPQTIRTDLQKLEDVRKTLEMVPPFSVVIHTAALAHGQRLLCGESYSAVNTSMTENLLRAIRHCDPRLIFLSSVAVYGEDRRVDPISVGDSLRPGTDYGRSKQRCEEIVRASSLAHCEILRLAPVYDSTHMKDVRKRVYIPGLPMVKAHWKPVPQYSLCHVNTVCSAIVNLLQQEPRGHRVFNVADPTPYTQAEIASWFPGKGVSLWTGLFAPLYWSTSLLPAKQRYAIRCLYWKLLRSNVYLTEQSLESQQPDVSLRRPGITRP